MSKKSKLELTWIGKHEKTELEPRVLVEDVNLSYSRKQEASSLLDDSPKATFDNMLIHGDNLLALKALEANYAGKIKCIYIDPPYNTGSAFEHYDDNLEHSIWLRLMKGRLEILRKLLSDDGSLWVQIDDNEMAYLTVMLDEIFGRENRINTIVVNMSNLSGVKINAAINGKRFPKVKEYILLYVKNKNHYIFDIPKIPKEKWDSEYNLIIPEMSKEDYQNLEDEGIESLETKLDKFTIKTLKEYAKIENIKLTNEWKYENSYRIFASKPNSGLLKLAKEMNFENDIAILKSATGLPKLIKTDFNRKTKTARIELVCAKQNLETYLGDHWPDIVTTGGVGQEGGGNFPNGKKPEKLISRVIQTSTNLGDIVLDSFLGSGTTCAVAHKMGRRWIGIEFGDHAYTHCKPRIDSVINGTDQTGVTKDTNWSNGGGYKFYELAPTLIKYDVFNQPVINKDYNPEMLAAAIAIHEGYKYEPSPDTFWKQSKSSDVSYLFVTTNHITHEYLDSIYEQMREDEFLLISCKSFESGLERRYKNIAIKKIPQSILKNCEFDVDDYSLNIVNPPIFEEECGE